MSGLSLNDLTRVFLLGLGLGMLTGVYICSLVYRRWMHEQMGDALRELRRRLESSPLH